ncbi:hypothetical protein F991_02985 [Acinetobacter sp. CIP-A165]|uniref:dihydrofolate reductase family protein n=1 Tax=Acinetobacter sp. CIP-A165 TaxID=40373 RepID=UPI0002CE7D16|nr:dihydrofolate reductase family protein [Acinetobacter sp. CIP-A165]ENU28861.1 hypothetical protein F991_02985 [Acinetobacter sp. CIP-A165]
MGKVICGICISVDGFVAGLNMTEDKPFGELPNIHQSLCKWLFEQADQHKHEIASLTSAGAFIMGRNMFGPSGAEYNTWEGWWGEEPPYHAPVFVLTHTARENLALQGGTTFHFVTDGIQSALEKAKAVAGEKDVAIAGGADTVNQYLKAGIIDELWLQIVPVVVGQGKRLFEDVPPINFEILEQRGTNLVTHIKYRIIK